MHFLRKNNEVEKETTSSNHNKIAETKKLYEKQMHILLADFYVKTWQANLS